MTEPPHGNFDRSQISRSRTALPATDAVIKGRDHGGTGGDGPGRQITDKKKLPIPSGLRLDIPD
jgi:hypothetical protein